jgi:hypothetical protein
MCGGVFDLGDDAEAKAEAIAAGIPADEECGLVCDDCYKLTPWPEIIRRQGLKTGP